MARHHTRESLLGRGTTGPRPTGDRPLTELNWKVEYASQLIGACGLMDIDPGNRRATYTIGFFVPSRRGIGLGREVTELVLTYGFERLALHRVGLVVMAGNVRAPRCYESCGFVREGLWRSHELYPAGWRDAILMGILADELGAEAHPPDIGWTRPAPISQCAEALRTKRLLARSWWSLGYPTGAL